MREFQVNGGGCSLTQRAARWVEKVEEGRGNSGDSGLSRKPGRTRHDDSITTSPIRNALLHATFALNRAAMHPSRSISATPVFHRGRPLRPRQPRRG